MLEVAKIQSTGASNRIEGIYTSEARLMEIVKEKAEPRNRNEQEIKEIVMEKEQFVDEVEKLRAMIKSGEHCYISGDDRLLDDVKELWEGLNEHHRAKSQHFTGFYSCFSFETRKAELLKKAQIGCIRVEIAFDEASQKRIGYCISSVDNEKTGEVESIYILPNYRGLGLGEELMQKALNWMDKMGAVKKAVTVAAGNEDAFKFYERFGFYPRRTMLEQCKSVDGET